MSSFDDWVNENHPGTVMRNGLEYLDADMDDMRAAYNAGLEANISQRECYQRGFKAGRGGDMSETNNDDC